MFITSLSLSENSTKITVNEFFKKSNYPKLRKRRKAQTRNEKYPQTLRRKKMGIGLLLTDTAMHTPIKWR